MIKQLYSDGKSRNLILDFEIPLSNGVKITDDSGKNVSFIIAGRNKIRFTKEIPSGYVYLETYLEKKETPKKSINKIDLSNIGFSVIKQSDIDYLNGLLETATKKSEEIEKRSIDTERLAEIINGLETDNKKKIDENWILIQNSLKEVYSKINESYENGNKNIDNIKSLLSDVVLSIKKEIDYHINEKNPHNITKKDIGLENVDNTPDLEKPISNEVKKALDEKLDKKELSKIKDEIKKSDKKIEKIYNGLSNMGGGIAQDLSGFATKDYVDNYHDSTKQDKIDSSHKLSSDLVDDTNQTNKFVSSAEKTTWNNKQDSIGYTPENVSNKVTSISSSSTNTQYPSALCVWNIVGDIEATINTIRGVA